MSTPSALFVTTVSITLEAFLVPFARHFRGLGWRIDAAANGASSNPEIRDEFDTIFDISWSRNPISPKNLFGSASKVRELVSTNGYDIVHVHTPVAAFVTRFALRRARTKKGPVMIYTAHGFHFYQGGSAVLNAAFRTLERTAAHWTDYLVTINREDYGAAQRFGGIDRSRVRLIPGIGVDVDRFSVALPDADVSDLRARLGVRPDSFMLTMVAELAPVKRHAHVLEALSHVEGDVVLVLVGEGPLETRLREQVRSLGLEERVRFAGYRRDIPAVLAASDALVIASEREGLNRSVLEAMAAGKPVIGTQTRGIADAIDPETGWLVPKHDARALAAAITEAAAHPAEARRRGLKGRERASEEFALPKIVAAYEELYREALASRV